MFALPYLKKDMRNILIEIGKKKKIILKTVLTFDFGGNQAYFSATKTRIKNSEELE